jgi:hypothetical protein
MKLIVPLSVAFLLAMQGCASDQANVKSAEASIEDNRPCVTNFSTEGGFWTGKQFKTYQVFPKASKSKVFDELLASIASSGFQIQSSNKETGMISANQGVVLGQGKTVPLNALIKESQSGGVRVDLVFALSGTLLTSSDGVRDGFCKLLATVTQTKDTPAPVAEPSPQKEPAKSSAKTKAKKQ